MRHSKCKACGGDYYCARIMKNPKDPLCPSCRGDLETMKKIREQRLETVRREHEIVFIGKENHWNPSFIVGGSNYKSAQNAFYDLIRRIGKKREPREIENSNTIPHLIRRKTSHNESLYGEAREYYELSKDAVEALRILEREVLAWASACHLEGHEEGASLLRELALGKKTPFDFEEQLTRPREIHARRFR